jgi:hypothetical protein
MMTLPLTALAATTVAGIPAATYNKKPRVTPSPVGDYLDEARGAALVAAQEVEAGNAEAACRAARAAARHAQRALDHLRLYAQ